MYVVDDSAPGEVDVVQIGEQSREQYLERLAVAALNTLAAEAPEAHLALLRRLEVV